MAKIESYQQATQPLSFSDMLIGTDVLGPIPNATKNFSLTELYNLFATIPNVGNLQDTLNVGNSATQDIFLSGIITCNSITPTFIEDYTLTTGIAGQFLQSSALGIIWATPSVPNLQSVLNSGNTATQDIFLTGNISLTKVIPLQIQDSTSSTGSVGQSLFVSMGGLLWANPATVTSIATSGLISGGPITTTGTISTSMTTNRLVGRGTSGTGVMEEIILGTNLSLTGTTLNATGGGVTSVTGTFPVSSSGGATPAISMLQSSSIIDGYLSSIDWTTFNNKQNTITLTTTGTSGVSTLIGATLNIPNYGSVLTGYVPYTGATQAVNLGAYDLTVQNLTIGKGNNSLTNNTALGYRALFHITTGNYNTAVGYESSHNTTTGQYNTSLGQSALFTNTTGSQNTALGLNALLLNTSGGSNVVVGLDALQHNTTGSSNTALGYNAGSHITGGATPNTTASNSVFIGRDSKPAADGETNQIVIGQNAVGNGSNTATFGNTATTANYFTGAINGGSFVKSGGTSSQFLKADGSVDSTTYGTGTVTSVAATVPTFLSVSGSPITTSGTLAVTLSGTALPVLNGGTGVTTSTGSGNTVLSTSPTLVTPILGSASATALTFTSTAVSGLTINKLTTTQRQALTPVMGDVVYDTTIGTTCTYTGTFWQYSKEYYVTANVSTIAATASNITGLTTFTLEANSSYSISGQFLITCSSTGGVRFGNSLPPGAVSYINYAGASTSTAVYLQQPSNIGALTPIAHNRNSASSYLTFGGVINIGATSGAVSMQFASGIAAQTSTIYGNFPSGFQSKITLTKIA